MEPTEPKEKIEPREITEELKESYLDYAISVIVSRALPDVRDGLKPVHRRILYAMLEDGLKSDAKFRKSATVIGSVLGRYHPHGDIAVYDALVRMAQDFSLRYPLVNGQGNFGCFTKDTKIKLTDGRNLSFEELIKEDKDGRKNYTYTVNHSGLISVAEIKCPRLTNKSVKIMRVVLDNGQKIRCTLNHKFMLRNDTYKEAKDLKPGESLMPLYQKLSEKTDEQARNKIYPYARATRWDTGFKKYYNNEKDLLLRELSNNHKVLKTEFLSQKEDVYDLTIDNTHNFALAAGVFVHNSIDGDSAAAYRYTESRLAKIAEELLVDIEKETVDWQPNYDNTRLEPKVLPAKFPNLLVNGTMGIAVGMTTNIPPHNLAEIAEATKYLIDNPQAEIKDLVKFVPGPDFPTGGYVYNKSIAETYALGKGSVTMQAAAEIQEQRSNQFSIVITAIPYQVNKSELIIKMAELVSEKKIEGIRDIRDESDREGLRIVIELKNDSNEKQNDRRNAVKPHSWKARADKMTKLIFEKLD